MNKSLNPKWYDAFKIPIVHWDSERTMLSLEVFDKNAVTSDVPMGRCIVNLNRFKDGMRHDLWIRLDSAKSGKLHVAITNLDESVELRSTILEVIPGIVIESWDVQTQHLAKKQVQV